MGVLASLFKLGPKIHKDHQRGHAMSWQIENGDARWCGFCGSRLSDPSEPSSSQFRARVCATTTVAWRLGVPRRAPAVPRSSLLGDAWRAPGAPGVPSSRFPGGPPGASEFPRPPSLVGIASIVGIVCIDFSLDITGLRLELAYDRTLRKRVRNCCELWCRWCNCGGVPGQSRGSHQRGGNCCIGRIGAIACIVAIGTSVGIASIDLSATKVRQRSSGNHPSIRSTASSHHPGAYSSHGLWARRDARSVYNPATHQGAVIKLEAIVFGYRIKNKISI